MPKSGRGTTRATSPANKSSRLKCYILQTNVLMIALHFPFLQQVHSRVIHFRRVCEYEYDMENMCWPAIATPQLMQSDKNVWARLEPSPFIYFKSKAAILRSYAIDAE